MTGPGVRWDWYQATIDGDHDDRTAPAMALALGASLVRGKGRNGYAVGWSLERDDSVLAQVHSHSARLGEVHVTITSDACDEVVPLLRRRYTEHRVSRADSALDFGAEFDDIDAQVLAFATERGLSHRLITSSDGGATRYVGAPSSEVRMRVYKKSEQLRALHPDAAEAIPDGIVRAELQARPGKREVKERVGRMDAGELWGLSQWSMELGELVLGIDSERVSTHFRRPTDWGRALHFLKLQYGPSVQRRAEQIGTQEAARELLEALGLSA